MTTTNTTNTTTLNNTLILEMRGCNFSDYNKEIKILSDVGNYRVGCYDNRISAKNGRRYILEFGGYDKYTYRKTNKRTGAPLKKEVKEIVLKNALHINTEFEEYDEKYKINASWRDSKLEENINAKNYTFTKAGILAAVNEISTKQYNNILLVCDISVLDHFKHIRSIAGAREKDIINNLERVKHIECNKEHYVVSFISVDGYSFSYDLITRKICG